MYNIFDEIKKYKIFGLIHHPLSLEFKGNISKKIFKIRKKISIFNQQIYCDIK